MGRIRIVLLGFAGLISLLLTACGANGRTSQAAAPVFNSTPVTEAVEGAAYSYSVLTTDSRDKFALSSAPAGALLAGNVISWTPTAAQSRVSNSFTVTATAPGGASTTQSWTVTPNGTIRISWIDTLWNANGSTASPRDFSGVGSYVAALVPQADGSFKAMSGTPGAIGSFEIPNIPAGYFWLRLSPRDIYWTSSSTFDAGTTVFVYGGSAAPAVTTTNFIFNFTGLEPTSTNGFLQFQTPDAVAPRSGWTTTGSRDLTAAMTVNGNADYSVVKNAFVTQYKPSIFGYLNGSVLGPELTLSNLSLTNGTVNTISGTLNPSVPAVLNLSVEASAWMPLLEHIAPVAPTAVGGGVFAKVQPYTDANNPNGPWASTSISLLSTQPGAVLYPGLLLSQTGCSGLSPSVPNLSGTFLTVVPILQPMASDIEAGTVQFSDPFPSAWWRTLTVCQNASVSIPVPGAGNHTLALTNSQTTSMPTSTVKPLISAVQNPKINGADLFTASMIKGPSVTLSWDPPSAGKPFGYEVTIEGPTTSPSGTTLYQTLAVLSTAKSPIQIPPDLLAPGSTYLFKISSMLDGRENMETSPKRSSLPVGRAELVSAPQTLASSNP